MVLRNYFRNAHDFVNKIDFRYAALRATVAKAKIAVPRLTACSDVGHCTVGHWATAGCTCKKAWPNMLIYALCISRCMKRKSAAA